MATAHRGSGPLLSGIHLILAGVCYFFTLQILRCLALSCWEAEIKSVYLISGNMRHRELKVTSELTALSAPLGLCGHVFFFSALVHLSTGRVFTLFFSVHHFNLLCRKAINFSSHCVEECKAGRKEGKTMVSMETRL